MARYVQAVSLWSDRNLVEAFTDYIVDFGKIHNEDVVGKYMADGWINEPDDTMYFNAIDLEDMIREDPEIEQAVDWSSGEIDTSMRENVLHELIKFADYYLVYAAGCRWNGADGYKIADSIEEAFYRDYDVSIYPNAASPRGKTLRCIESSHDVPTGSDTYIIALTTNEKYELEDMSLEGVHNFVKRCATKIVEPEKLDAA